MPVSKFYGRDIDRSLAGSHKLVANPATTATTAPIAQDRFCRNGMHPSAILVNTLNEAANQSVMYRTKQLFTATGPLVNYFIPSTTDHPRWRFAFRTSVYHRGLYAHIAMIPDTTSGTASTSTRLDIYSDATESTLVSSTTFTYGITPFGGSSVPCFHHIKKITQLIEGLNPDTDYYAKVSAVNKGILFGASICELGSMTEQTDGFLPQGLTTHSAIIDDYRENLSTISYNLWRRAGSMVLNWTVNDQNVPLTTASSTAKNIIDQTSTSNTATSPGYTLDLTGKARVSQTSGVPVVMKVFALNSAPTVTTGVVRLVDSSGATVLQVSGGWTGTGAWQSAAGVLPAGVDKFDLMFSNGGSGTLNLSAVGIWEQD